MNIIEIFNSISILQWAILGVLVVLFIVQMVIYLRYFTGILRHRKKMRQQVLPISHDEPSVSVVICARNEYENLQQFLPSVLEQDYPNYEVIVVNDGLSDETEELLARLKTKYPHLRSTYTPTDADVISRKKLALTVGIKAAKNDILLLTDADCKPSSAHWIKNIVRHFTPGTEFVLGYGAYMPRKGFTSRLVSYDTLFIAVQYLGNAYWGKPYMGVGRNLAYRRETFFEHKGFAGLLHIASGDDDLFVNKFANATNTQIATEAHSITWSVPKSNFREWIHQKERHLTTSPLYSTQSKRAVTFEPVTRGLFYLALVAAFVFWNPFTAAAAGLLFVLRFIAQCVVINKTANCFNDRHFYISILFFDIFLPLVTLTLLTFGRRKINSWK